MSETLRVVAGMLALEEFTTADLVSLCHVKDATVRTVIGRRRQYLDILETPSSGKRGGRAQTYRVKPDMRQQLSEELPHLPAPVREAPSARVQGMTMAFDLLARRVPLEADSLEAYDELLELARLALPADESTGTPHDSAFTAATNLLLKVAELERAVVAGSPGNHDELRNLADAVVQLGSPEFERALPASTRCDLYRRLITGPAASLIVNAMRSTADDPERIRAERSCSQTGIGVGGLATARDDLANRFPAASKRYGPDSLAAKALHVREQHTTFQLADA